MRIDQNFYSGFQYMEVVLLDFGEVRPEVEVDFDLHLAVSGSLDGNSYQAIAEQKSRKLLAIEPFKQRRISGVLGRDKDGIAYLFVPRKTTASLPFDNIYICPSATDVQSFLNRDPDLTPERLSPRPLDPKKHLRAIADLRAEVQASWSGGVMLQKEKTEGGVVTFPGFRAPQIGALHALQAHWTVSSKIATVVMPTGTGKTETMIAASILEQAECVLVVVPTDALRTQIALAFAGLGILRQAGLVFPNVRFPVVSMLRRRPTTPEQAKSIFETANVVVTTMAVVGELSSDIQSAIADTTTHLFIDEAHHIGATKWRAFRQVFDDTKVVQFTATPFRYDGMRVDGKFIFVYPLGLAQSEGYFRRINYRPVDGLDRGDVDRQIIQEVGEVLGSDERSGYRHLAMARGNSRARAEELHEKYLQALPKYQPILIHSGLTDSEQKAAIAGLRAGRNRIAVCVDMLGEGFDLPELKIAGLHDPKKSEAVTLQFVGRFTRTRDDLGEATIIAATTKDESGPLSALFAEDADWNKLINLIGSRATARAVRREEVFQGFEGIDADIPLETLRPTLSTIVYETPDRSWDPAGGIQRFDHKQLIVDGPHINSQDALAIFVTERSERPKWSRFKGVYDVIYDLYLVHWDQEHSLLYICTSNDERIDDLAKAVCGSETARIHGEVVFRALDPLRRPLLNTLGLSETRRRRIRYSQYQGSDIAEELKSQSGNRTRAKTNLMVVGYSEDGKTTLGCSKKGKIWTQERTNDFGRWMDWCHGLGASLIDETISTDGILERLIRPVLLSELPDKPPVAIDWYEGMSVLDEDSWVFKIGPEEVRIYDAELVIRSHEPGEKVLFALHSDEAEAEFAMLLGDEGARYVSSDGQIVMAEKAGAPIPATRWFSEYPPTIYFADGDSLVGDEFFGLPATESPYFPDEHFVLWDWTDVDIRAESQGLSRRQDSVQAYVIRHILDNTSSYIVFDDDGAGEVADVVAFELDDNQVTVRLYHCKYSSEDSPGARVGDLYEVCGQAQRSVRRCERPQQLIDRLMTREAARIRAGGPSRFMNGGLEHLKQLRSRRMQLEYRFEIYVVQPGYSFAQKNSTHTQVLAATEAFVIDTYAQKFRFICNA